MLKPIVRFLVVAAFGMAGCVQYTPVELGAVPPNEEVRVRVTDEGAIRLARHLGRITEDVTASVAPRPGDSIAVTVWLGRNYPGTQFENVRETVVLPRGEVAALRLRKLSTWRTAALSAGALVATLVLANEIFQIGDPNRPPDDGDDPPPSAVVPLFRIRFGWIP